MQKEIEDALKYNEAFDHHKDDYQNLILRKRDTEIPKQLTYEEQEIFIDVRLCKGKIISCAAWHPKREGYFAIAYVSNRPGRHFSGVDTASEYLPDVEDSPENIHDRNPVLLWSFKDRFHSKLTLLSPRPVQCLKFCPHNADILVGGLTNGQIVIWDLTENLRRIEGELDTSEWRAVERTSLKGLSSWKKKAKEGISMYPTAVSSPTVSHKDCVTDLQWIAPTLQVCRDGVLEKVPPTSPTLQFLSCSLDGHMYGWNLLEVPTPKRKKVVQKKSAKRPRSEGPERTPVSPYAKLHGLLQPHFKVSADYPISSFSSPLPAISGNRLSETDEVASTYGEIRPEEERHLSQKPFHFGATDATLMEMNYMLDDTKEELMTALQFTSMADVHDGPIEALERSHFVEEILISLGGRVFAIWSEDYKGQPLYWRQYKIRLTACRWFLHRPSMFLIAREDGRFETWDWFLDSCQPIHITDVLGKPLTGIYQSPINHDNIFGVADSGGTFRIFNVPHEYTEFHPEDGSSIVTIWRCCPASSVLQTSAVPLSCSDVVDSSPLASGERETWNSHGRLFNQMTVIKLRNMFEQHVECKRLLTSWTTKWKEKFADFLKQKRKEAERLHKLKMIKEKEKIRLEKERLKAIKEAELALQKRTKLLKWQKAQEIWDAKQEKRAIGILLSQKNLDNDHLETEQKPFVKLQEEQKSKRIKQTEVINMNESIYKEILSLKFPDLKEELAGGPEIKETKEVQEEEMTVLFIELYEKSETDCMDLMQSHPFDHKFQWMDVVKEAHSKLHNVYTDNTQASNL
ncbi:dynein axonemal intermediate chain 3-like [Schistocerca serialis cubense]|uniref:dynein axonemal intermediate chain 3-like n=1 Tax=Schistocerca serialis cubense TaxID=2023355 RepID=UPI00214F17A2|nr:dynein axonemal intermediate chain 3-like [Schistocerca serialis cubense]